MAYSNSINARTRIPAIASTSTNDRAKRLSPALARELAAIPTSLRDPPEVAALRKGELPSDPTKARVLLEWCSHKASPEFFSAVAKSMDRLETVALSSCRSWAPLVAALRDAAPVTELTMSHVRSNRFADEQALVDHVQGNPQLRSLGLHHCHVRPETMSALMKVLADHPGIERLAIETRVGPDSDLAWLPDLADALQTNTRLKDLSMFFGGTPIDREGHHLRCEALCHAIAGNADLSLQRLRLPSFGGMVKWDPKGSALEKLLVNHPALTCLELTYAPGMTAGSWKALGQMKGLERLMFESFGNGDSPDGGGDFVAAGDGLAAVLRDSRSLRQLSFVGGQLDTENVAGFEAAVAGCQLEELFIPNDMLSPEIEKAVLAGLKDNITLRRVHLGHVNDPVQSYRKPTETAEVVAILQRNKGIQAMHGTAFAQGAFESTMAEMGLPKDIGKTLGRQLIDGSSEGYRAAAYMGALSNGTRTQAHVGAYVASPGGDSSIQQELDRRVFNDVRLAPDDWRRMNPFSASFV